MNYKLHNFCGLARQGIESIYWIGRFIFIARHKMSPLIREIFPRLDFGFSTQLNEIYYFVSFSHILHPEILETLTICISEIFVILKFLVKNTPLYNILLITIFIMLHLFFNILGKLICWKSHTCILLQHYYPTILSRG